MATITSSIVRSWRIFACEREPVFSRLHREIDRVEAVELEILDEA